MSVFLELPVRKIPPTPVRWMVRGPSPHVVHQYFCLRPPFCGFGFVLFLSHGTRPPLPPPHDLPPPNRHRPPLVSVTVRLGMRGGLSSHPKAPRITLGLTASPPPHPGPPGMHGPAAAGRVRRPDLPPAPRPQASPRRLSRCGRGGGEGAGGSPTHSLGPFPRISRLPVWYPLEGREEDIAPPPKFCGRTTPPTTVPVHMLSKKRTLEIQWPFSLSQ